MADRYQGGRNQNKRSYEDFDFSVFDKNCQIWMQNSFDDKTITFAENFGKYLAKTKRVSTSQVRNIFAEIQRIKSRAKNENFEIGTENFKSFLLLKPKMAYMANKGSRGSKEGLDSLNRVLVKAHFAVTSENENKSKALGNFCDLFEAIVAYHKAFNPPR